MIQPKTNYTLEDPLYRKRTKTSRQLRNRWVERAQTCYVSKMKNYEIKIQSHNDNFICHSGDYVYFIG